MSYPVGGEAASPVWCAEHQAVMREAGLTEPAVAAAVALLAARMALRAAQAQAQARAQRQRPEEAPARPDVRPSRPARTARARSGPGAARTRLH